MYEKDPVKIFVVEDDPAYTKFLKYVLGLNPDYEVEFFTTGKECLNNLHKNPAVVTLDYSLPDMPGEKVLSQIRAHDPNINVIIISAQEKIGTAVDLLKLGAYDYITKDHETKDRVLNSINNARNKSSNSKKASSAPVWPSKRSFPCWRRPAAPTSRCRSRARPEQVKSW
jgi:DNA-binding NtrC family response regulator